LPLRLIVELDGERVQEYAEAAGQNFENFLLPPDNPKPHC
jgi:hypothetical protein